MRLTPVRFQAKPRFISTAAAVSLAMSVVATSRSALAQDPKPDNGASAQAEPPKAGEAPKSTEAMGDKPEEKKYEKRDEKKDEKSDGDKKAFIELTTLRILHEKGTLTDAEYESALKEISESNGARAGDSNTVVVGKFATTLYGFVEADAIYDSTESYAETAGQSQIARPGSYAGDHDRMQMSIRNSRFGVRSKAPEYHGIRASMQLEMDFLGTQLPVAPLGTASAAYNGTEAAFFTNPTFRARHANLKVETPYVDVLFGQYWALFGWGSSYHPNTVQIQGVPGEIYNRNVQLRLSKTIKTDDITFEAAIAGVRPAQRDTAIPDGQAGLRFAYNKWTGVQTTGSTSTQIAPVSVAVTGDARNVRVPSLNATPSPTDIKQRIGTAIAVDGFIPVIPGDKGHMGNSLSINGEFASGYGDADLYTGLGAVGAGYPSLPNPTNANPAPAYAPNIDAGIMNFDSGGGLHLVQWTSWLVGVQYYLPGLNGHVWLSGNYSRMTSGNIQEFVPTAGLAKVRSDLDWFDVNLFADLTPAVRLGGEYADTRDGYADGTHARNQRLQFSMFYIF